MLGTAIAILIVSNSTTASTVFHGNGTVTLTAITVVATLNACWAVVDAAESVGSVIIVTMVTKSIIICVWAGVRLCLRSSFSLSLMSVKMWA